MMGTLDKSSEIHKNTSIYIQLSFYVLGAKLTWISKNLHQKIDQIGLKLHEESINRHHLSIQVPSLFQIWLGFHD